MCEGLKSAPRGASRGTAHHICTTFAKLFSPIAPGEPLFSRVRVAAPSWLGCVGPASPRRPVGRRRGRERGFQARQFGTTCCHWWSYGEGVGHKYLDRAEGIQRGTPALGPGNFRGLEARPGCGHNPSAGSLGASRTMSSTSSSDMGGRPGPRVDRQRRHLRLESSRCRRRRVSSVTRKERQRHRGSNRERAARHPMHRAISDARIELALEDKHLVAEHHDLDVLVHLGPPRGSEQAEVTEGEGHGRSWSLVTSTASSGQRSRFWCPTTLRRPGWLTGLLVLLAGWPAPRVMVGWLADLSRSRTVLRACPSYPTTVRTGAPSLTQVEPFARATGRCDRPARRPRQDTTGRLPHRSPVIQGCGAQVAQDGPATMTTFSSYGENLSLMLASTS